VAVRWLRMRVVVRVTCSGLGVHGVTSHARRTCVVFRQKKKCYTGLTPRGPRGPRGPRARPALGPGGAGAFIVFQFLLQNCVNSNDKPMDNAPDFLGHSCRMTIDVDSILEDQLCVSCM
jgi:hypothetical protein